MLNERRDNMALSKEEKILIGKRIKEIRLEKGMTTKEFGKLLSATDSNVSSWEKGRTSPNPERLKVIAKIGGTTVEELINVDIDYQNFKKLLIEKDANIKQLLLYKIANLPYEHDKEYKGELGFSRTGNKIMELIFFILWLENPTKEDFNDFEYSTVYDEMVTQLMSEDFSYYWRFAYDLCYSDASTTQKNYIEDTFLKFILEVFSKNEKYVIPLIEFVLNDTKETIKDITMTVVKRTDNTVQKELSKAIDYNSRNELLEKIDDLIQFVDNIQNK